MLLAVLVGLLELGALFLLPLLLLPLVLCLPPVLLLLAALGAEP